MSGGTLERKVILIAGGNGKFGRAFSFYYENKYEILTLGRKEGSGKHLQGDVTLDSERLIHETLRMTAKIDVLINATVFYRQTNLIDKTGDEFESELKTNLIAPLVLANEVVRQFWAKEEAARNKDINRSVVNVSSIAGAHLYKGKGTYSATKAGLNMLTRHMALEYENYGIRANAVAPEAFIFDGVLQRSVEAVGYLIEGRRNGTVEIIGK